MDYGSTVIECINNSNVENIKVKTFGYQDCFVQHGEIKELEKKHKLDADSIYYTIKSDILLKV